MQNENERIIIGVSAGVESIDTFLAKMRTEPYNSLDYLLRKSWNIPVIKGDAISQSNRIKESIKQTLEDAHQSTSSLFAIGVALPGQIDSKQGTILEASSLGLDISFPLGSFLTKEFDCYVSVLNDVKAQANGEIQIGNGRDFKDIVYIFVDYGIGSCIIINNNIYLGSDGLAGEIGHATIDPNGPKCLCGNSGCLEVYSSVRAIEYSIREAYKNNLSIPDYLETIFFIKEAIGKDDKLVKKILTDAGTNLGIGVANIINTLNPDAVILSGQIIHEIPFLFELTVEITKGRSLRALNQKVKILTSALESKLAESYGAALFASQQALKIAPIVLSKK